MDQDCRKDFAFLTLAGQNVAVYTSDGAVWEGIFVATDGLTSESVVLSAALRIPNKDHSGSDEAAWFERCFIPMNTVMYMNAVDVKMQTGNTATEKVAPVRPAPLPENPSTMQWDEDVALDDFQSEEKNWKAGKSWDQFKANETKFGVKSTYDSDLYTTKLKMNTFTPAQIAEAERKAREIETSVAVGGIQQRIERGEDIDIDEGELYSDVKRAEAPKKEVQPLTTGTKPGAYVPPSKRQHTAPPQQPSAAVPPQPLTTPVASSKPMTQVEPPAAPKEETQQQPTAPASPTASISENPKAGKPSSSLSVTAKAWTPGGAAVPAAPVVDFATAFVNAALDAIRQQTYINNANDGHWFHDNNNNNNNNFGNANTNFQQQQQQQQGYSSSGYNGNQGGMSGSGGYSSGPGHQSHQSGFGGNQQFNSNQGQGPSHFQSSQQPQQQPTQFGGGPTFGRGRGGAGGGRGVMSGQPQQPNFAMGGRGGGMQQPINSAPQPLDSVSDMPRSAPAPADPAPQQESAKPKMKRGR